MVSAVFRIGPTGVGRKGNPMFSWPKPSGGYAPQASVRRLAASLPAIAQIVVAVLISYAIAHYALGHAAPVVAVTVTISSLGLSRDARPVRVLETAIGVTLGITLSELIVLWAGQGLWQLGVGLGLTLMVARLVSPSPAFAIVAGVQAVLVAVLPAVNGGPFTKTIDGVIGGAVALLCTALVPRDPRRAALRDGRAVLDVFSTLVTDLVSALRSGHRTAVDRVLDRARETQAAVDQWRLSLDSAVAIVQISPIMRRHRMELAEQKVMQRNVDLAMRNLRVVTRRLAVLARDGSARPEIADILADVEASVRMLKLSLDDPTLRPLVRQGLIVIAVRLDPVRLLAGQLASEASVVYALRPMLMDLMCAAGLSTEEARAALPGGSVPSP
jgi:uncharacterized membrane protein YgaE (UPF0421/DUF939 family)